MSEFTPITTQEAFDAAIKERLARAEEKYSKKYEGYMSADDVNTLKANYDKQVEDLKSAAAASAKKYADIDKQLAERDAKIKGYETDSVKRKIADEMGLSSAAVGYLQGEDEETIRKSAEGLKALTGMRNSAPPLANHDDGASKDAALKKMLSELKF